MNEKKENKDQKQHIVYSPEMLLADVDSLSKELEKLNFNIILGIAKGGLFPATLLAYKLKIKDFRTVQIISYCDETNRQGTMVQLSNCTPFLITDKVLIVDDIADSGKTLDFVIKKYNLKNWKVATLVYKTSSKVVPDFYVRKLSQWQWVDFFWEYATEQTEQKEQTEQMEKEEKENE